MLADDTGPASRSVAPVMDDGHECVALASVFVGGWALQQLWLFWVAPILGAALAGIVYPLVAKE